MRAFRILRRLAFCVTAVTMLSGQSYTPSDLSEAFEQDVLIISASERACYRFNIWLAETMPQQRRGLMFVRDLPAGSGMLFVYGEPGSALDVDEEHLHTSRYAVHSSRWRYLIDHRQRGTAIAHEPQLRGARDVCPRTRRRRDRSARHLGG